jgi:hypothetical protein|tara:strand:+ start:899 stop:1153 length:255 start_codon:yes stop_codon:yes gene_type:complete
MTFWQDVEAKLKIDRNKPDIENEIVIDLQKQLSRLTYSDVEYLYTTLLDKQFRGREIEEATALLLKLRFIKNQLKEEGSEVKTG